MINKYRLSALFIACFLGVLLFSTNSFSRQFYTPFKLSIEMEADKNNHNSIRISISAFCPQPFKDGKVLLKVPPIGANPEYITEIWSGDSTSSFDMKFENIVFDLPKGNYRFVAGAGGVLSKSGETGTEKFLYVEVGDSETLWSDTFMGIESDKILIEAKKRGFDVTKGTPVDPKTLPDDLQKRIDELHRDENVKESGAIDVEKNRPKGGGNAK